MMRDLHLGQENLILPPELCDPPPYRGMDCTGEVWMCWTLEIFGLMIKKFLAEEKKEKTIDSFGSKYHWSTGLRSRIYAIELRAKN